GGQAVAGAVELPGGGASGQRLRGGAVEGGGQRVGGGVESPEGVPGEPAGVQPAQPLRAAGAQATPQAVPTAQRAARQSPSPLPVWALWLKSAPFNTETHSPFGLMTFTF